MAEQLSPVLLSKSERRRRESGERSSSVSVSGVGFPAGWNGAFSYLAGTIPSPAIKFCFYLSLSPP